jgi:hypothetical protein
MSESEKPKSLRERSEERRRADPKRGQITLEQMKELHKLMMESGEYIGSGTVGGTPGPGRSELN